MRILTSCAIAAAVGAIALGSVAPAAAADIPVRPGPGPEYYGEPAPDDGYVYRRPPTAYIVPPPRVYYAPPVAVGPAPYYYPRPFYGPVYGALPYAYGPRLAWGYGPYRRPWAYGYRRW